MKISILKVQASDLERAINAMLKPVADPKDPGYHAYQDIYTVSNMRAREYISMLYTCTEVLLTSECAALFDDEIRNSAEKDKIIERNPGLLALTTMYGSLYGIIMDEYKDSPDGESIQFSKLFIRDLNLSEKSKEYSYTLEYDSQNVGTNYSGIVITERKQGESIYVTTDIMRRPLDVVRQMNLEDYSAFIEQKKRAGERYLSDLTVIAATGALTPICPEAAIAINLLYEAGAGISGNTLYYSRELVGKYDERLNSDAAKAGQKAISKTVDYFKRNAAIDSQIARLEEKMQAQWFYSGGTYSVNGEIRLAVAGICDPEIIEKVCKWEEEGIQSLIKEKFGIEDPMKIEDPEKLDQRQNLALQEFYEQIGFDPNAGEENKRGDQGGTINEQKAAAGEQKESTDESNGENKQNPEAYYLWNGGCNILSMDSNEFNRIIANLQENYNNASGYNISVESIFH